VLQLSSPTQPPLLTQNSLIFHLLVTYSRSFSRTL
jgi:hypothetical protein